MCWQVNGKTAITPKPETEEYNVRNFIYKQHRPFHPERLWRLVYDKFILQLEHPEEDGDDGAEPTATAAQEEDEGDDESMRDAEAETGSENSDEQDTDMEDDEASTPAASDVSSSAQTALTSPTASKHGNKGSDDDEAEKASFNMKPGGDLVTPSKEEVLANKRANPLFARLFRSKGTYWLATRPDYRGIWSQAGAMLTLVGGTRWDVTLDSEELSQLYHPDTTDPEIMKQVRHDMTSGGEWGDRRQEIVFIGEKLDVAGIREALDDCLLTDIEWTRWKRKMRTVMKKQAKLKALMEGLEAAKEDLVDEFDDAFPEWEGHFQDEEYGQDGDEDEDGHEGHHH